MKIGILGAGAWGTALAILSKKAGNQVTLWSYDGTVKNFDGIKKQTKLNITKNISDLSDMDAWLVVTPAAYFRETIRKSAKFYKKKPIIICTKGIEPKTNKFMSEILNEEIPNCKDFGVLSGPQFAAEVANDIPTGSTLAGTKNTLIVGRQILKGMYLEESNDIIGAEICGVGKNAVALISGYTSIKALGENEKALLFTRAWNEVVDFGLANGAKIRSFLGLCGIGDLFLSATSKTSRNYSAGLSLANKQPVNGTVEGISALNGLIFRSKKLKVSMPVLKELKLKMGI
jgi:glycerol-3-phosphate dehydrogenase (NAD(P)+)